MPRFKTSTQERTCTPGWPQEVGYPRCEITKGGEVTATAPDYFVYCCPPAPVDMRGISGVNKRSNFRNNVPRPRGVHSYYNMMWDPRVKRGDVRHLNAKREEEECEKIRQFLNKPRKGKTYAEIKAENQERQAQIEGSQSHKESVRFTQLQISNLIPKDPEKYLLDLSDEIDVPDPCYKGRRLQTLRNFPIAPSKSSNDVDTATQIYPGDFFDFEGESQPIIEKLLGAVLEQAHFEILEEEELEALRLQLENFEMKRAAELLMIDRLNEREQRIQKEKNRLENGDGFMSESTQFYNICAFTQNMTKEAMAECILNLKKEKYLVSESSLIRDILEQEFNTWLNDEVSEEIKLRMISRRLLDEIMMDVVNKREGEYAEAIWREVYEDPLKLLNDDGLAPPPTPGTSLVEDEIDADDEEETLSSSGLELPKD